MMIKTKLKYAVALCCLAVNSSSLAAEISTNAALMQAMDKVTGRVNKIVVPVDSEVTFGDFSLVLRACKKRPAEETPENFAFLDVTDKSFGTEEYNIFRGWMLSSTPGINAIEHPIYDVWLLECVDEDLKDVKILSVEELKRRDELPVKNDLIVQNTDETTDAPQSVANENQKVIKIKEFINEDKDIEKDIQAPAYISESSASYVSDIDEGAEPENLLLFTKMQEESASNAEADENDKETTPDAEDDLSKAIEAEINNLQQN